MKWLDALTEQPRPIVAQAIRRESPLGPWDEPPRELSPRWKAEKERRERAKAMLRPLTDEEMDRVRCG